MCTCFFGAYVIGTWIAIIRACAVVGFIGTTRARVTRITRTYIAVVAVQVDSNTLPTGTEVVLCAVVSITTACIVVFNQAFSGIGGAAFRGADVSIVAVFGQAQAKACGAGVFHGAKESIVTRGFVEGDHAAIDGVAGIVCAGILVVADQVGFVETGAVFAEV